ncbi:MAG: Uma2 family endonuclease [Candidatus Eremiobacteraeota bacterium]|nr:Uma2 family endonuclease [Candidatus Eremiobacteraeota bacterium]
MSLEKPNEPVYYAPEPDVSHLVTEDEEPVDNFFQDKQADLLTEALRVSWDEGRPFLSAADVGIFYSLTEPPIVPDVLLSTGVEIPPDFHEKNRRCYYTWLFGKPPEVAIEIVSNGEGKEDTEKLERYTKVKVPYYVIFDPAGFLSRLPLRIFQLSGASYVEKVDRNFPEVGLGLTVWRGEFDGLEADWLRWVDRSGELLAMGHEQTQRVQREAERADREAERAKQEASRREALEARLRELGVDPETV